MKPYELIISFFGTVAAIYFGYHNIWKQSTYVATWTLAYRMLWSTVHFTEPEGYVSRPELRERMSVELFAQNSKRYIPTILVVGPRGCGKSTILREIFSLKKSVVRMSLNVSEDTAVADFISTFCHTLNIAHIPEGMSQHDLIMSGLTLLRKWGVLPTLLVEINEQCSSKALQNLLILMKTLGADDRMVKPVVVLSSTGAAMTMNIGFDALRIDVINVPDMSNEQVNKFVRQTLEKFDKKCVGEVANKVCPLLGNRAVELQRFARRVENCNSLNEAQDMIDQHISYHNMTYESSFKEFVKRLLLNKTGKDDLIILLEMLKTKGSVEFFTFCDLIHMNREEVIGLMSKVQPHVFYVDPLLQQVTVSSTFALNAIKNFK